MQRRIELLIDLLFRLLTVATGVVSVCYARGASMRTRRIVGWVVVVMGTLAVVHGQVNNRFVGTWRLNLAKSKYSPGPAPKTNTVSISPLDGGLSIVVDGIDGRGMPIHLEDTAILDGTDRPVK